MRGGRASSPLFLVAARGGRSFLVPPALKARGDGAPIDATFLVLCRASFSGSTGAHRRAVAASLRRPGRAFGNHRRGVRRPLARPFAGSRAAERGRAVWPAISQLLAGGHSASERSPGAARARRVRVSLRPRAPHPAPPSRRLMTAPLDERDWRTIIYKGIKGQAKIGINYPAVIPGDPRLDRGETRDPVRRAVSMDCGDLDPRWSLCSGRPKVGPACGDDRTRSPANDNGRGRSPGHRCESETRDAAISSRLPCRRPCARRRGSFPTA